MGELAVVDAGDATRSGATRSGGARSRHRDPGTPARPPGGGPVPQTQRSDTGTLPGHDFGQVRIAPALTGARQPLEVRAGRHPAVDAARDAAGNGPGSSGASRTDPGKQTGLGTAIGAVGGAAVGAGIGFGLGGPVGALIGAGVGALAGGLLGYFASGRSSGAGRSVTVNITRLAGTTDTTAADLGTANTVFSQAGVSVARGAEETLSAADSTAVLGADNTLDEFSGPLLTAEETMLLTHNRTPGRITAYWVPSLSAGSRGEAMIPSYHGVADSTIVISSSARAADSFAHELGHCLLDNGSHDADPNNLMASGSIRNFTDRLTDAQIRTIQSSRYV